MPAAIPGLDIVHPARWSSEFAHAAVPGLDAWGERRLLWGKLKGQRFCDGVKDDGWCQWVLRKADTEGFTMDNQRMLVKYLRKLYATTPEQLAAEFSENEIRRGLHRALQAGDPVRARRRLALSSGDVLEEGDTAEVAREADQNGAAEISIGEVIFDADEHDVEPAGVPLRPDGTSGKEEVARHAGAVLAERRQDAAMCRRVRGILSGGRCRNAQGEVSLKEVRAQLERDFHCSLKQRRAAVRKWVEACDDLGDEDTATPAAAATDSAGGAPPPKRRALGVFGTASGSAPAPAAAGPKAKPNYYHDGVSFGTAEGAIGWETGTSTTI
eukprot:TRINITY_DN50077_c0_g1_i1.p1 TRINITY_DN50077_c0_g1~~TRINITY_DN50077_c0_g1_i1.p1  ORF type:complete len:355 (+),score=119.90 TRINITY_DN50077_c0_g1_i1:86-1066(+)